MVSVRAFLEFFDRCRFSVARVFNPCSAAWARVKNPCYRKLLLSKRLQWPGIVSSIGGRDNPPMPPQASLPAKPVSASAIHDQTMVVFPNDLNTLGTLFGGRVMEQADILAATVAKRHA